MSYFDNERLDAYKLAVEVARAGADAHFSRGDADLKDQAVRSSRSVVLHIPEGRARGGIGWVHAPQAVPLQPRPVPSPAPASPSR